MSNRVDQMAKVQAEGLELFRKKNTDYGDSFATYGPIGVIVRMGDKISRLNSVTNSGINLVNTESVRDTLIDLHNYAAMAIMLIDENNTQDINFPSVPKNNDLDRNLNRGIRRNALPLNQGNIIDTNILDTRTSSPNPGQIVSRQHESTMFQNI